MPLLGKAEKGELEALILEKLCAYYDQHGPEALMDEQLRVVVDASGAAIDRGEHPDPLAAVSLKTLFTALCYQATDSPPMPREALASLATEATSVAAAQVNRIAP